MTTFIAVLLSMLTFIVVAYPFFKPRSRWAALVKDDKLRRRGTTDDTLQELESEFQSGLLTEAEYHDLKAGQEKKTDAIAQRGDEVKMDIGIEAEIERQVQALRQRKE